MYASETIDTVTIEAKSGPVVVTIQKLNWKALKKAAQIRYDESIAQSTRIAGLRSGSALISALAARSAELAATSVQADAPKPPVDYEKARQARYSQYDAQTVLEEGIRSSSDGKAVAALIADLEEAAADRLHHGILDLTLPPIDPAVQENERKNG